MAPGPAREILTHKPGFRRVPRRSIQRRYESESSDGWHEGHRARDRRGLSDTEVHKAVHRIHREIKERSILPVPGALDGAHSAGRVTGVQGKIGARALWRCTCGDRLELRRDYEDARSQRAAGEHACSVHFRWIR